MATPYHDLFVAGDYIISPKVYNEFSPGTTACNSCNGFSYRLHGAVEFDLFNLPWMVEGDYRAVQLPASQWQRHGDRRTVPNVRSGVQHA